MEVPTTERGGSGRGAGADGPNLGVLSTLRRAGGPGVLGVSVCSDAVTQVREREGRCPASYSASLCLSFL